MIFPVLAMAAIQTEVLMKGRDLVSVPSTYSVKAVCAGVRIELSYARPDKLARARFRVGHRIVRLPADFLGGLGTLYAPRMISLGCDGTRAVLEGYLVRRDNGSGEASVWKQDLIVAISGTSPPEISPLDRFDHVPDATIIPR